MQLQTTVPILPPPFQISHQDTILSIGSCFAENVADHLRIRKFDVLTNPFGILYNPLSMANSMSILLSGKIYTEDDLIFYNERWQSFDHHGDFSNIRAAATLDAINQQLSLARTQLQKPKREQTVLMLTLGTAFVYYYQNQDFNKNTHLHKAVANCHKMPANWFKKELLEVESVTQSLFEVIQLLKKQVRHLKIIITISPVRHIRDGIIENQRSKATLVLAVHELLQRFSDADFVYYFPAYEIALDELRDYRFYDRDLVHPNSLAVDYIWARFADAFFDKPTQQRNAQFLKLHKARQHRAFHPDTAQHQRFLRKQLQITQQLIQQYPYLDFGEELAHFASK